jgi:outer membrane protein
MRTLFISLFIALAMGSTTAQPVWTLEGCINYAREHNITIKRQKLSAEHTSNVHKQSKYDKIPTFNAFSNYQIGFGRRIDNVTNNYTTETTQFINMGVNSEVVLFRGFTKKHQTKQDYQNMLAAIEQVAETENDISLLITSYYLNVLFAKELLAVAKAQYEVTQLQVNRTQKLVDAGSVAMGDLLLVKSQLAREHMVVADQENNLAISTLNLAQLLDFENASGFDIESPVLPNIPPVAPENADNVYRAALVIMPQIKRDEYNLEASRYQLKKSKGYLYPYLSMGGGWTTQASKNKIQPDWDLSNSLSNNLNSYVGMTLNIPIFNGLQARMGVKNSKIAVLDAQYALQAEKLELRKEIEQARADAIASQNKYMAGTEAVNSTQEAFSYTEKRFEVGMVNSVDYNTAKTDLMRAQSELLQSKYEYVLRTKVLDFYKGIPLKL